MNIQFTAHGEPKAQPRVRAFSCGGRARVYDPGTAEGWKSQVAEAAREHIPGAPIGGPVKVSLSFRMWRPKGHYGVGRNAGVLKASAPSSHTKKPDIDNLTKAVLDALTCLGFWRDDCQVIHCLAEKGYQTNFGDPPGVDVRIEYGSNATD